MTQKDQAAAKARVLFEALPYIQRFHGKTIVVKFGGNAMTDGELKTQFAQDVVLLKLVGINPVVVHGGGPQIEQVLARMGKKGEFVQGMRVTDAETMDVVEMVLGGQVNKEVVELINQAGGKAVGLTGQDGAFIRARKMLLPSKENGTIDLGQVGEIESIDPGVISTLEQGASFRSSHRSAPAPTAPPTTSTPTSSRASSPRSCAQRNWSFSPTRRACSTRTASCCRGSRRARSTTWCPRA
jgi:acetylglutamate kinase